MSGARGRLAARLAGWAAIAAAAGVVGLPDAPSAFALGALAPLTGGAAGAVLFVALAGGVPSARIARPRVPAVAARSAYLAARAAFEELVWRACALAALAAIAGTAPALALTTVAFALAHVGVHGRRWWIHLVTGATFGTVFCATGSLAAAVAAHATYNVLAGVAAEAERRPARRVVAVPASIARLEGVTKSYGTTQALRSVDLELARGEVVALLGRNGAGKTTAISILLGLRRPDRGRAVLFGGDPRDPSSRRGVGATPQEIAFPLTLRVGDVVELVRAHFADAIPAALLLERFGLAHAQRRQVGALSGGERRRLAVALAFAGRPALLVLDEPTAGLDVESRRRLWEEIREQQRSDRAVLLTTHQLEEAEALASRVVVIEQGRIVTEGTVRELKAVAGLARVRLRAASLPALPTVARVERDGDRHTLYVRDADVVVAELIRRGVPFAELEVAQLSLEDAFLALTERPG